MWVCEYRVWHEKSPIIELTRKYDAVVRIYLLNVFFEKKLGIAKVLSVTGREWHEYVNELCKLEKRVHISRVEGNQIFYSYLQPESNYTSVALERDVFFLRPLTVKNGFEYWTLASWDRKKLIELPKKAKGIGSKASFKLLSIRKEKPNLFVSSVAGSLSPRQLQAFQTATEMGYYEYPRKIALAQLAKILGMAKSTLREHLRIAESKLMPATATQIGRD